MPKRIGLSIASFILLGLIAGLFGAALPVGGSTALAAPTSNPAYAWGYNLNGESGNGTITYNKIPGAVQLPAGVSGFFSVAAGATHSLGLGSDNKLYAWGNNRYGQLGTGTNTGSLTPIATQLPAGVSSFTSIAAGGYHTLGLGDDDKLYAWGFNYNGQLGNGTNTNTNKPVAVKMPTGVRSFTAFAAGYEHNLGLGSDGKLYAWGENSWGELGIGPSDSRNIPVAVQLPAGVNSFTAFAAGGAYSLGLGDNGKLYAWGFNRSGALGDGTNTNSAIPVAVQMPAGVSSFTAIAAGGRHSLGLGNDGKLYAWGFNQFGALGDGTTTNSNIPVAVQLPAGVSSFTTFAGGWEHSLGLGDDGKLYAWGSNLTQQVGNGKFIGSSIPLTVPLPPGVSSFAAGGFHNLAIASPEPPEKPETPTAKTLLPANLVAKLRVSPDRAFSVSKEGEVLAYTISLKNFGPGKASMVYAQLPLPEGLEAAYTEFSRKDIWLEKIVLTSEGAEQSYLQIKYPDLEKNLDTEVKLYFRAKTGASVAEGSSFLNRAWVYWTDEAKPNNKRGSNGVRVSFTASGNSLNLTDGEVQTLLAPQGTTLTSGGKLNLVGDFYAPGEQVTFWYTDKSNNSTELGSAKADETGTITLELKASSLKTNEEYVVASYGNTSGIYGSAVIQLSGQNSQMNANSQSQGQHYTLKPLTLTNWKSYFTYFTTTKPN